jgi:hypothetical protein
MLITLQDDGVLCVYETPEMAVLDVEALDVENVLRAIFDETAQPYIIDWLAPNQYSKSFFGLLKGALNGQYRLIPKGERDPAGLLRAIRAAVAIDPPRFEPAIRDLERHLTETVG